MVLLYELNSSRYLEIAFLKIYGIGKNRSKFLTKSLGLTNNFKSKQLDDSFLNSIILLIKTKNFRIKKNLKKKNFLNLKRLVELKTYKGLRRIQGLPVRGQRSRSNAKTSKKLNK